MEIRRVWAMPNKWTFQIPPIAELLIKYVGDGKGWIDPYAGSSRLAEFRNDLNPSNQAPTHLTAKEWASQLTGGYAGVLFDPPYSPRQIRECYNSVGLAVHTEDTNGSFWCDVKDLIGPKIKVGGYAISFGWNTTGFGKGLGFKIIEILLVCHGGYHNDTIVTVEKKINANIFTFDEQMSEKRGERI